MGTPKRKLSRLSIPLIVASLILVVLGYLFENTSDAASGCCSGHQGVCGCQCCDGTPLSDTCRARMPACKDAAAGSTKKKTKQPFTPSLTGSVTAVLDGDTIVLLHDGTEHRIRLADVDCPEAKQPFGYEAGEFTRQLCLNQRVTARIHAVDRYGRQVADVHLPDGRLLNALLLQEGLAWWYRDYSKNRSLQQMEEEARINRRGLWSMADPIPPWVFRRKRR